MKRTLLTLSGIALALTLVGCASDPAKPSAAASTQAAAPKMTDAEMAAKLKGEWTGEWSIGTYGGKFVLVVTEVNGTQVKGEGQWYGTATGDTKSALKTAEVKDGQLKAEQNDGAKFDFKMTGENKLKGTWTVGTYNGPLVASRSK